MLADSSVTLGGDPAASAGDDDAVPSNAPEVFRQAVDTLLAAPIRSEAILERIRPPQRLAPWSFAVAVDIDTAGTEGATGRLVVLYDPDGAEAWDGEIRLVAYAQADLAADMAGDPLLPAVGWSWLTEALEQHGVPYTAVGGTVTQTTSTRFGDVHGRRSTTQLELRGSWTATEPDLTTHVLAFVDLLAVAAGLPPEGVAVLGDR
jgi:hypothetical protein